MTTREICQKVVKKGLGSVPFYFLTLAYPESSPIKKKKLESCAVADPPSSERLAEWVGSWERCTKLEKGFWDMGLGILWYHGRIG